MASLTITQETANNGTTGSWSTDSNTGHAGGTALYSTTNGATITFNNVNGRAIYLVTQFRGNNLGGASPAGPGSLFSVTIDGVAQPGVFSNISGSPLIAPSGTWYRCLVPLARNLSDSAHTVVLTSGSTNVFMVDALVAVSGFKSTPTTGLFTVLGDSWSNGVTGASNNALTWPSRVVSFLASRLSRTITLNNMGLTSDSMFGIENVHVGGQWRLVADAAGVIANGALQNTLGTPEWLSLQFSSNDLAGGGRGVTAGDYIRNYSAMLSFIQDYCDTSLVKVLPWTPGSIGMGMLLPNYGVSAVQSATSSFPNAAQNYRMALSLTHSMFSLFPDVHPVYAWEAMDGRSDLVQGNTGIDLGNHPNDAGHTILANEVLRAAIGGGVA